MSTGTATVEMESEAAVSLASDRPSLLRWIGQPVLCVVAVAAVFIYVNASTFEQSVAESLNNDYIFDLFQQHLKLSLAATALTVVLAVPVGVLLTRGPLRRFSLPIMTVAGFGQAAPAIGLIALFANWIGLGFKGAMFALVVYGVLPIIANTVAGLDGVDPKLIEASRGMGMSGSATLLRVELPLALPVIIAGIRIALVLIVGTATLATFVGAGGLGDLITTGIKLVQTNVLIVGAILVAALALFIDWLARVVELIASPKGLSR